MSKGLHFIFPNQQEQRSLSLIVFNCVCLSFSVEYSPLIVSFLGSVTFPLTLCFALLCHLSLLRLLLCVSCQVLDIMYDLVLCPDCETPDKTSISATNTKICGLPSSPASKIPVSTKKRVSCTLNFGGICLVHITSVSKDGTRSGSLFQWTSWDGGQDLAEFRAKLSGD